MYLVIVIVILMTLKLHKHNNMRRTYKGKNNPFYGKHHTEETNEKNRTAHLGNKNHWKGGLPKCIDCGKELKNRYAKRCLDCDIKKRIGSKRTIKTRKLLSKLKKGTNCNFWKGGISKENEIIRKGIEIHLWREAVFARDNWICQKCKIRGGEIHPHHIYNFSDYKKLRTSIENGITLCKKCHQEFHKKYGVKNNIKEQLEEFLTQA